MSVDLVTNWTDRLKTRLYTQFRHAITWQAFASLLGRQFNDLESSGQSMLTLLNIELSEGANLDLIGRVVGQNRLGVSDETYRQYLRARVLANRSTGTVEDIYDTFVALFPGDVFRYVPGWVKQFVFRLQDPITGTEAYLAKDFLLDSKEAGARGILEWQQYESPEMFTLQTGSVLNVAASAGATTLTVVDTEQFLAGGGIRLDYGLPTEETLASYTVASSTTLTVPALAYDHGRGCAVELMLGCGKGFGDATDDTIGGYSEQAEEV